MGMHKIVLSFWIYTCASISVIKADANLTQSPNVVFENTTVTLTCQYNGVSGVNRYEWKTNGGRVGILIYGPTIGECSPSMSPNASLYEYSCPERNRITLKILNVTQSNNRDKWNCVFYLNDTMVEASNLNTIIVQVPVTFVEIFEPVSTTVTVKENTVQVLKCRTSISQPIPTIQWYLDDGTTTKAKIITDNVLQTPSVNESVLKVTTGTLSYRPTRLVNEWQLYCSAQNINSSRISLNITYQPNDTRIDSYPNNSNYSVIAGKQQTLTCRAIDGNPPARLFWSCFTGSSSNSINRTTVTSQRRWTTNIEGKCTCVSVHIYINQSHRLNVEILNAVNNVKFHINNTAVSGNVKVINDSAVPIVCSASGSPTISYRWTHGTMNVTGERLFPKDILQDGTYTCSAYNTLVPTQGQHEPHISASSIDIIRLYEPVVHTLSDLTIVEGNSPSSTVVCQVTPGNPPQTSIKWTRGSVKISSRNRATSLQLPVSNVHRSEDGTYNCTAENTMDPTTGQTTVGRDSKQFHLIVFYNTSILKFEELNYPGGTEITVMESDKIQLNCLADSKPDSTISITKGQEVKRTGTRINNLVYTREKTTCLDTGIYTCIGFNDRIDQVTRPSKNLQLHVKCGPRLSPINSTELNQTSKLNTTTALQVYILAYPAPTKTQLIWKKNTYDTLTVVNDDRMELQISTNGIFTRASLLIHYVQRSDFGEYQLHVEHEIYDADFTLFFIPKDKPSPPTNSGFAKVTVSSAEIYWTPGFNGGFVQTFIIMYRKDDELQWLQKAAVDTNENTMSITLDNLESGSGYIGRIYATNVLGNSSAQSDLYFATVAHVSEPSKSTAAIIGGAVAGCLVVIAIVCVSIVFGLRRYQYFKAMEREPIRKKENSNRNIYQNVSNVAVQNNGPGGNMVDSSTSATEQQYETLGPTQDTTTYSCLTRADDGMASQQIQLEYENLNSTATCSPTCSSLTTTTGETTYENLKLQTFTSVPN